MSGHRESAILYVFQWREIEMDMIFIERIWFLILSLSINIILASASAINFCESMCFSKFSNNIVFFYRNQPNHHKLIGVPIWMREVPLRFLMKNMPKTTNPLNITHKSMAMRLAQK